MHYHKIRKSISLIILSIFIFTNTIYGAPDSSLRVPLSSDSDLIEDLNSRKKMERLMAYLVTRDELPELKDKHLGWLRELENGVLTFVEREGVIGIAQKADEEGCYKDKEGQVVVSKDFLELLEKSNSLELFGISTPKKYGGSGFSHYFTYRVHSILSSVWPSLAVTLAVNASVQDAIRKFGTPEQKEKYLPRLAKGKIGGIGITESGAGSDAWAMETFAEKKGKHYVLNGTKIFITSAGIADVYIVFAVTDRGEKGKRKKEISAFLVEKDTPGFTIGTIEKKKVHKSSPAGELIFKDCKVPEENMLGNRGDGKKISIDMLTGGHIDIASVAHGIAEAAYERAVKHAKERLQFGKPIGELSGTKEKLPIIKFKKDASKALIGCASLLKDQGLPQDKKALGALASMAKLFSSEKGKEVVDEAVQILAKDGTTEDPPLVWYSTEIIATRIYEGTSEIQRGKFIQKLIDSLFHPEKKTDIEKLIDSVITQHRIIPGYETTLGEIYKAIDNETREKIYGVMQDNRGREEEKVDTFIIDAAMYLIVARLMLVKTLFLAEQGVSKDIIEDNINNTLMATRFLRSSLANSRIFASVSARSLGAAAAGFTEEAVGVLEQPVIVEGDLLNASEKEKLYAAISPEHVEGFEAVFTRDKGHMAEAVAGLIHDIILEAHKKGEIAVGRMPVDITVSEDKRTGAPGVYDLLVKMHDIDWSKVIIPILDGYGGPNFDFHEYIYENLIEPLQELNKPLPRVYCFVDNKEEWPADKVDEYEQGIEEYGQKGIHSISPSEYRGVFSEVIREARPNGPYKAHFGLYGVGKARITSDGKSKGVHIAFNEEGSGPDSRTRRTELSARTIFSNREGRGIQEQINKRLDEIEKMGFEGIETALRNGEIPKAYANTIGMYEALEETELNIVEAKGESKLPSVDVVVLGELSPDNPATYMRGGRTILVVDQKAGGNLIRLVKTSRRQQVDSMDQIIAVPAAKVIEDKKGFEGWIVKQPENIAVVIVAMADEYKDVIEYKDIAYIKVVGEHIKEGHGLILTELFGSYEKDRYFGGFKLGGPYKLDKYKAVLDEVAFGV